LILLDEEQVMAPPVNDLGADVALAEHGVTGDQAAFEGKGLQEPKARLMLIGLVGDAARDGPLGERQPRLVGHEGEQVHGLSEAIATAPGRLAVQGEGLR
jgi:hypothetical protein